jgi:hypothetical protein
MPVVGQYEERGHAVRVEEPEGQYALTGHTSCVADDEPLRQMKPAAQSPLPVRTDEPFKQ